MSVIVSGDRRSTLILHIDPKTWASALQAQIDYSMTKNSLPAIDRAIEFSELTLGVVRELLAKQPLGAEVCVVATGSFGRREASGESDVDFFVLHNDTV